MEEGFLPVATSYGTRLRKERHGRTSNVPSAVPSLAGPLRGMSMWLRRVVIESVGTLMVERGRGLEFWTNKAEVVECKCVAKRHNLSSCVQKELDSQRVTMSRRKGTRRCSNVIGEQAVVKHYEDSVTRTG